jgi:hypothetical protein
MAIEKNKQIYGVGSDIAKAARALRLDQLAQRIAKATGASDCGCKAREERLNNPDLLINKIFYKNNDENIKE